MNRHTVGPGEPALSEWRAAGLALPDLPRLRRGRLARIREQLRRHDLAGIVLTDPVNVRYATDSTNMQVWLLHNAARYAFVGPDGPVILWEYEGCEHLSAHSDVVDEIRACVPWHFFTAGPRHAEHARRWAAEIADVVHAHGRGNRRLAIDHGDAEGGAALAALDIDVRHGESLMEAARSVKSADEIAAMRCAIHACEQAMAVMHAHLRPGISEQRLWGHLHAETIARGSEWIECRLLASGPRCNPWYQECSSRVVEDGDLVAFDTDLVGAYGYMCDTSRTWLCGERAPTPAQRDIHQRAHEQLLHNTALLRPGLSTHDLTHRALVHDTAVFRHYSLLYHGVGMCDEAPAVVFPDAWAAWGYDDVLEPGMVMCVESYVGRIDGGPGVKLEDQVLITETGHEVLTAYPFENRLF